MAENKVVVNIYGEQYPIMGVTDSSHISRVADLVDKRMREAAESSQLKARDKVAILASMSIASELLEKSAELSNTRYEVDSVLDSLLNRLERVLADAPPQLS